MITLGLLRPLMAAFSVAAGAQVQVQGVGVAASIEKSIEAQQHALCGYSVHRVYRLENKHLREPAELEADVVFRKGEPKTFHVTSMHASGAARRALQSMLKEEVSAQGLKDRDVLWPGNYLLTPVGDESCGTADCLKVSMRPVQASKYLIDGTGWVNRQDHMFTRIEGALSKSPSFWLSKPHIEERYSRIGEFWLPSLNRTTTSVLFFGEADLTIEYSNYTVTACASDREP